MHVVQRVHDTDQTAVAIYFVNLYLYKTKKIYCGSDWSPTTSIHPFHAYLNNT